MEDDKVNLNENQPTHDKKDEINQGSTPIFQAVPVEVPTPIPDAPNLQAEEVSPELTSPQELETPPPTPPSPPSGSASFFDQSKLKYLLIGAGALVFIFILVLVIRLAFSGQKKEQITLSYWGLWDDQEIMQPLIDQYKKTHDNITVKYEKMSPQSYKDKLVTRSRNNQGPDIFRFHNTWIPEIKDVVSPLPESVMSAGEFERTFYKIAQKDLKVDNRYYGIPLSVDGLVLIYNEDLLKKAGISSPPTSWEDVLGYAAKLTTKTKDNQIISSGIALGTANNIEHFSDIFALFLVQNGGSITKLESREAGDALAAYRNRAETPNNLWDETMPNSVNAFIQGKVAMILAPSWEILTIQQANPDIVVKSVPVPSLPDSKPISIASYWVEGVSKFSAHQKESWEFLRYLSEKEQETKLYEQQAKTRKFGAPYSRVDLASTLNQNDYIGAVIKEAESDAFVSVPMITRTYDNGLNDETVKYIENAINSAAQGVGYGEAMRTAKLGVDQILSRYSIGQ